MKRTLLSSLLLFVAAATLSGCSKDETSDPATADIATISATVEEPTRTKLDGEKVKWETSDKIMVVNTSNATAEYTLTTGKGTTSGTFTGKNLGAGAKFALYPYSATATCASGKFSFEMPAKQENVNFTFGNGANPMIAQSDANGVLNFKNVCGAIRLQLKGTQKVSKIVVITATTAEKLSGKATVALNADGLPVLTLDEAAANRVTLNCNNAQLDATTATSFYVVVPAATYTKGLQFMIYDETDTPIYSLPTRKELIVTRSQVAPLPVKTIKKMNFPDPAFRAALVVICPQLKLTTDGDIDVNNADNKQLFANKADLVVQKKDIKTLQGIEYFTGLAFLSCGYNQLTNLDISKNTALTSFGCHANQLTSLDLSKNTMLTMLWCYDNKLPSLDVSQNAKLTDLYCHANQIPSLDLSQNTKLTYLYCHDNKMSSLDISTCPKLTKLACGNQHANGGTGTPYTKMNLTCSESQNKLISMSEEIAYNNEVVCTKPLAFPDANFRAALAAAPYELKLTADGDIDVTNSDNQVKFTSTKEIDVSFKKIVSLKGIEYFTGLEQLNCYYNDLTSLDVSKNKKLIALYSFFNPLKNLDLSQNTKLTKLNCKGNQLKSLDVSQNTALTQLYCDENQLTSLNVSTCLMLTNLGCGNQHADGNTGGAFTPLKLTCSESQKALTTKDTELLLNGNIAFERIIAFPDPKFRAVLTAVPYELKLTPDHTDIDVSNGDNKTKFASIKEINVEKLYITTLQGIEYFTRLTRLQCNINQLTSLDISKNTALTYLDCSDNQLTGLDVSQNTQLTHFDCESNQLTGLDVSQNKALTKLYCHVNQLQDLDVNQNKALTKLACYNNQLQSLDIQPLTSLTALWCGQQLAGGVTAPNYSELKLYMTQAQYDNNNLMSGNNDNVTYVTPFGI